MRRVAAFLVDSPRWVNMSSDEEARLESWVTSAGIAVLLLQRDPEHPRKWLPVATWGRCLDTLELHESRVMLELKALREGSWKLSEFTAFHSKLSMVVSPELRALLKISNKAHPQLQAMLIDLLLYKPKWLVASPSVAPAKLQFHEEIRDSPLEELSP